MLPHEATATGRQALIVGHARRTRSPGPGALARIAARVRPGSLDRALIAGADASGSAALAARAATLTSRRSKAHIAEGLERALRDARRPQRRWSAVAPSSPLPANATGVRELAALLRDDAPLHARGIALLNQLLTDGSGPAYRGQPQDAARLLDDARAAMLAPPARGRETETSAHSR